MLDIALPAFDASVGDTVEGLSSDGKRRRLDVERASQAARADPLGQPPGDAT